MPRASSDAVSYLVSVGNRAPAVRLGVAVVSALVESIVRGEIPPGGLLPPEQALSRQFGVSRTVIRESIKRVEEKGLLRVAQGRGTEVATMSAWNILDPLVLDALVASEQSLSVLDDLTAVRMELEGMLAADAARAATGPTTQRICTAWDDLQAAVDDGEAFAAAEQQLHRAVASLSGNRIADSIAQMLADRVIHAVPEPAGDRARRDAVEEHRLVVAAVCGNDPVAAEQAMRRHIERSWHRRRGPSS